MPIPVQCSHCEAILNLKDERKDTLGKKMRCPKCDEVFVMKRYRAPEPEEVEEVDDYEEVEEEYEERPRRSAGGRRGSSSRSRSSKSKKPASGNNKTLIIALSAVASVVLVLGIGWMFLRKDSGDANTATAPVAQQTPVAGGPNPTPAAGHMAVSSVPAGNSGGITDAEYEAFSKEIERKVAQQKGLGLMGSFNVNKFLDRSLQGLDLDKKFVTSFRTGFSRGFSQGFTQELDKNLDQDGHYRFLRVQTVGTQKQPLFRMASDAGSNYHALELSRSATGQLEIVDMHIALSGELLSETIRRTAVLAALSQKGSFLSKLTGQLGDFEKSAPLMDQFNRQKAAGQFPQALATFKRMPTSIQNDKTFALGRLSVAMQVNEQEYLAAMTDYRRAYPTDASIDFLAIDYHLLRKEFDQGLAAIDRVEKSVGGDIYLNILRTNYYGEQNKWDEAKKAIAAVIAAEPTLANPVFVQLGLGLTQPDFKLMLESLRLLKQKHNLDMSDAFKTPEYADFVKSPEYQEWLKSM